MATTKRLDTRFITWKSGTDLKVHLSDNESRLITKPTYRSTGHWAFVMNTLPWTRFQTRGTDDEARFGTLVVNALLTAGLLTLGITSSVLGVARASTSVLAIQLTLARVLGMAYVFD